MRERNTFRFFLTEITKELTSIKEKYKEYFSTLNIYEFKDKLSIDLIVVKEKSSGHGSALMKDLCLYADKTKKMIILTPSDEFGSSKSDLIKFYKKFNFVENNGDDKIFGVFEEMYRLPK